MMQTKMIIKQLRLVKKKINPILFDLKDGSLVRTRPSRYQEHLNANQDARSYMSSDVSDLSEDGESLNSVSGRSVRSK